MTLLLGSACKNCKKTFVRQSMIPYAGTGKKLLKERFCSKECAKLFKNKSKLQQQAFDERESKYRS